MRIDAVRCARHTKTANEMRDSKNNSQCLFRLKVSDGYAARYWIYGRPMAAGLSKVKVDALPFTFLAKV